MFPFNNINYSTFDRCSRRWFLFVFYRGLSNKIDHLLQILELQLKITGKNCSNQWMDQFLMKNILVTGRNGSGKKTVVGECCQRLWAKHLIYYKFVDCLTFKGRTATKTKESILNFFHLRIFVLGRKLENIVTSLTQIVDEIVFREPSILVLDHFDDLFPNDTTLTDANLILATQKLSLCKFVNAY